MPPPLPVVELLAAVEKEHRRALARKVLIERRKEDAEREVMEKVGTKLLPFWRIGSLTSIASYSHSQRWKFVPPLVDS